MTTDVAAAPFLWVLPLALYLLTFVAVFRERPWIATGTVARAVPFLVAPLAIGLLGRDHVFWLAMVGINLVAFVLLALLCHGGLYRRRPAPARLTEFYLLVSLGGVIGGIFAALIAPQIFIAGLRVSDPDRRGACWCCRAYGRAALRRSSSRPGRSCWSPRSPSRRRSHSTSGCRRAAELPFQIALVALAAVMLLQRQRPARFFALVVLGFVLTALWQPGFNRVETARSFFGVHQVVETADGRHRLLYHGTTLHGAQRLLDRDVPTNVGAGAAHLLLFRRTDVAGHRGRARSARGGLARVAAVGLGTGSLACHRRGGEHWTFFEIDPEVVRIARDPRLFTFLSACAPDAPIVLGDARLTLAASPQRYDLIVLDAFSSDAIPVHLLTREAIAGYLSRLEPDGVVVMHISNRHMELGRVVAAVGAAEGLVTYVKQDNRPEIVPPDYKIECHRRRARARSRRPRRSADSAPAGAELKPDPRVPAWTDDYSDIVGAILRKKLGW